ncbi:NAD(P)-binding protein [Nemania sp. FL0916]|nr:NAD(P)-binding protein [Nemania sp. FL0916]
MSPTIAKSDAGRLNPGTPLYYFYRQFTVTPAPVVNVSLQGKTAIVTGANSGIGLATSRQLLELGLNRLILAVRNKEKGHAAAAKLTSNLNLEPEAVQVKGTVERVDMVVLNAGMWSPLDRSFNKHTGHEKDIQVNYLSNALLLVLLLPIVKEKKVNQSQPTHITLVSSEVATFTKFKEQNNVPLLSSFDTPGKVDPLDRMFIAKLLGQFFLSKLCEVVPPSVALINCASPGSCHSTEYNREIKHSFSSALTKRIQRCIANKPEVGARTITDAVVNRGEKTHGQFLSFQRLVYIAPIIYTEEGKRIKEQLWKETIAEFSMVNAEKILHDIVQQPLPPAPHI